MESRTPPRWCAPTGPKRSRAAPDLPRFVTKTEIAETLRCSLSVLGEWMAREEFPPPWLRPGQNVSLWRLDHFRVYCETGAWPAEAWARRTPIQSTDSSDRRSR